MSFQWTTVIVSSQNKAELPFSTVKREQQFKFIFDYDYVIYLNNSN